MEGSMPPPPPPAPGATAPLSGMAVGSLVCGVLGFVTLGLASVPAIVLGHVALGRAKSGRQRGAGLAVGGLICGYVGLVILGLAMLAGMATPLLLSARKKGEEAEMSVHMRQLGVMMIGFDQAYGGTPRDELADRFPARQTGLSFEGEAVFNQLEMHEGIDDAPLLMAPRHAEGEWLYFPMAEYPQDPGRALLVSPLVGTQALKLRADGAVERIGAAERERLAGESPQRIPPTPRE